MATPSWTWGFELGCWHPDGTHTAACYEGLAPTDDDFGATDADLTYCTSGYCGECDSCIDAGDEMAELERML